jgi:integrase
MISATDNIRDRLIIEILAFTGCRRGELVLIRRCDVDPKRNIIKMPTIKRRSGTPYDNCRIVPIINENLKKDLEYYLKLTDLEFKPSGYSKLIRSIQKRTKDGISEVRVNQIVADIAEKANVKSPNPNRKYVNPHLFRHSFIRFARSKNLNYKVISEIAGHRSIGTTIDLYGTPDEQEIIKEGMKMSDYGVGKPTE